MASKRRLRRKRCGHKQCYPTKESATFAVRRLRSMRPGDHITSYKFKQHWHIGHTPHGGRK